MIKDLWIHLKETKKPILLYGMGNGADKIIRVLEQRGIPFKGVFASDGFVREKYFHGFRVTDYNTAKETFKDMIVLLCFGSARSEVIKNIKRIAAEQELYAPDVPVYGDVLFDLQYARQNALRLTEIYNRLADEKSKITFKNTVLFKITGDVNYLFECEVSPDEPFNTFFALKSHEHFMDLGAYRGDTIRDFLGRTAEYEKIYGVEPDRKTFLKLKKECEDIKSLELFNGCISDILGKTTFNMSASRGSAMGSEGEKIDSLTVDSILEGRPATLIKMDIEGAEAKGIMGAKNTILEYKPKMQISCYHKSEDLIELFNTLTAIRDDYKIYMRHFPSLPAWDTCYYFV